MEIIGTCVVTFISMTFLVLCTSIYCLNNNDLKESLLFWDSRVLKPKEFFEYFMLCIYSGITHYGDYIGYEVITFFASFLTTDSFVASIIVLNYANLIGYVYVGFGYPLSHFVGNFLGSNNFDMYKYICDRFFYIHLLTAIILGFITIYFSENICLIYTRNQNVVNEGIEIVKIWGICSTFDIFNWMFQAILRGAGKQKIISIWNLLVSIFWMIPISYILAFTFDFKLVGLYVGCFSYVFILCFVNLYYFSTLNLEEVVGTLHNNVEDEDFEKYIGLES